MIKEFTFFLPIKIVFGNGSFGRAGEEAVTLGRKAFIVTGKKSAQKTGLLKRLTDQLSLRGIAWYHFNGVTPNPTNVIVDEAASIARREGCDFVIGLGGGSAIDAAKSIAISAKSGLPIWRHIASWEDDYVVPQDALPIMAIETLAGTGSESDNIAVITNAETNEKPGYALPQIFPRVAIIDPEVTLSVSPRMTAVTGFDILCHTMEGFVSKVSNPICEILNERAMEYVINYLPRAVRNGEDLEARGYLAFANMLAGFSLTHSRATLLHAMEHPISGHFNVIHAEGLAALFPKWIEFSWEGNPEKFRIVGKIFGLSDDENTREALVRRGRDFLKEIGLDVKLSQLGVELDSLESLARDSLRYMAGGVRSNPVEAGIEDIVKLLRESY